MLIPALVKVKLKSSEMVTSLMLNYIILYVVLHFLNNTFADRTKGSTQTYEFLETAKVGTVVQGTESVSYTHLLSDTELCTRIRLIPFKSLGNENGMLLGIRCDMAEADGIKIPNAVMAVYDGTLDSGGLFRAIINYDTLDGRK